ncbi:hypothetical protein G6F57_022530 [Rhizopus arrhizus]|nr:hypothetical protein G6F57_022530 [Rhizopus arrhizus]
MTDQVLPGAVAVRLYCVMAAMMSADMSRSLAPSTGAGAFVAGTVGRVAFVVPLVSPAPIVPDALPSTMFRL